MQTDVVFDKWRFFNYLGYRPHPGTDQSSILRVLRVESWLAGSMGEDGLRRHGGPGLRDGAAR